MTRLSTITTVIPDLIRDPASFMGRYEKSLAPDQVRGDE